jgi:hypothetical protein
LQERSSIGRVAVSKTVGCRFKSCRSCQVFLSFRIFNYISRFWRPRSPLLFLLAFGQLALVAGEHLAKHNIANASAASMSSLQDVREPEPFMVRFARRQPKVDRRASPVAPARFFYHLEFSTTCLGFGDQGLLCYFCWPLANWRWLQANILQNITLRMRALRA